MVSLVDSLLQLNKPLLPALLLELCIKFLVLIIEHNLDVIKTVDHIIDIGYEGGKGGGQIIVEGTPEVVAKHPKSYTAKFLKKELN